MDGGQVITVTELLAAHIFATEEPHRDASWSELLYAMDIVVWLFSAQRGIDARWSAAWQVVEEHRIPSILVITDLDEGRVDLDEMTAIARRVFDAPDLIWATTLPALDDDERIGGVVDLIALTVLDATTDPPVARAADPEHVALLGERRSELAMTLAARVTDDTLATALHSGLTPNARDLAAALITCTASGDVVPALPLGSAPRSIGAAALIGLITDVLHTAPTRFPVIAAVPPRTEAPRAPTSEAAPCAQIIVTNGIDALVRVWSGTWADATAGKSTVLATSHPRGYVFADPMGSLQVRIPQV